MPDATGKMQLQDYDAALLARGFDGYQQSERYQMINLGYRAIARAFPMSWQEVSKTVAQPAGTAQITLGNAIPSSIDTVRTIDIISNPYRRRLDPMREEHFIRQWLSLDLTSSANQGIPTQYYVWTGNIWLLPPPQVAMTILIWLRQYLPDMIATTDVPVTPMAVDEMILDAALVRCHRRAHELQLAAEAEGRVQAAIDDLLADDVWTMEEYQERVAPDDQWL